MPLKTTQTKKKRVIDFSGMSVEDLGLASLKRSDEAKKLDKQDKQDKTDKIGGADYGNINLGNTDLGNAKEGDAALNDKAATVPPKEELPQKDAGREDVVSAARPAKPANFGTPIKNVSKTNFNNNNHLLVRHSVHFDMVRNYLDQKLGNKEKVELKLSVMQQELGMNDKTLYRHLKTLRTTEFELTKLVYGTEVRRLKG